MKYGVLVDGEFQERELYNMLAKGFEEPVIGRKDTYDHYVMREINRSYGKLNVKDAVVLDVGANIGAFSCWALQRSLNHIICIEPEVNNFNLLQHNVKPYYVDVPEIPWTLYNAALHSTTSGNGELWLATSGKNPGNSSTTERRGRVSVPISYIGVPTLKAKHPHIDVAKVDCEGAEYEFMEALVDAYPMLRQVALEIHISGFSLEQAENLDLMMRGHGFTPQVPPRLDNDALWQTLATYEREV